MAGTSSSAIDFSEFPSNLNVLVIDTDPGDLEFIEKSCKENFRCKEKSHKAVICSESSMAMDVLLNEEIDIHLIVMELHMPMMNDFEFLQFLDEEGFDIAFAFQLGAIHYFMKPFHDLLDLWGPFLRHYYDMLRNLDDETSDGEGKANDTLNKKDDALV
ncbi:hypothetical protein V8G54_001706 [Vigna mungo]|uniref:Response regulatory domain-containing protein n=1 Tax=Vigna mungo TaxID=3915 RepID=A0AAQ3SA53_VIGMU